MSLHAIGKDTGVVCDIGYDNMYAMPVINGHLLHNICPHQRFGGYHVTKYLEGIIRRSDWGKDYMKNKDHAFTEFCNDIKETLCKVTEGKSKDMSSGVK
jgi:actin-related protein